jgi:hypothetical protein
MKIKQQARKQLSSVRCPTYGVAAGKGCVLVAGGLRNEPDGNRKLLAAEALEKKQTKKRKLKGTASVANVPSKTESEAALLARLKRELSKPVLTNSVRQKATKKQIASWNAE